MNLEERRPPWYLLTGLVIGLALGLLYAWVWQPVEHVDTFPSSMKSEYKDAYRGLVAAAYVANSDLGRAEARLTILGDEDPARALSLQSQRLYNSDEDSQQARLLTILEKSLIGELEDLPTAVAAEGGGETPTPGADTTETTAENKATPTITLIPTASIRRTPTATPGAAFTVRDSLPICEPELSSTSLIQVYVYNAADQPIPGVALSITWESGEERFYTGLKPEFGYGYADFEMQPGVVYTVQPANGGQAVPRLTPLDCQGEGGKVWYGTWRVNYVQE